MRTDRSRGRSEPRQLAPRPAFPGAIGREKPTTKIPSTPRELEQKQGSNNLLFCPFLCVLCVFGVGVLIRDSLRLRRESPKLRTLPWGEFARLLAPDLLYSNRSLYAAAHLLPADAGD